MRCPSSRSAVVANAGELVNFSLKLLKVGGGQPHG
jgi:hypothetical protein